MSTKTTLACLLLALAAVACAPAAAGASGLVAPAGTCAVDSVSIAAREDAMLCLTNYARAHEGLSEVTASEPLQESAADKAGDILACDSFSHSACGREFAYWMRATGYMESPCWKVGENLAWGLGQYGTVTSIFRAWMRSPEHRQNILGDFTQVGIDLRSGELGGRSDVQVWTQHFGSHCEATA